MNSEGNCGSKRSHFLGDLWEDAMMETIHAEICSTSELSGQRIGKDTAYEVDLL